MGLIDSIRGENFILALLVAFPTLLPYLLLQRLEQKTRRLFPYSGSKPCPHSLHSLGDLSLLSSLSAETKDALRLDSIVQSFEQFLFLGEFVVNFTPQILQLGKNTE